LRPLAADLDPVGQHGVVHLPPGALTAGNQQQIGPWAVRQAVVRIDAEATTGQHRPRLLTLVGLRMLVERRSPRG